MQVFEHEPVPDVGPVLLLRLVEDHLPGNREKQPGGCRDDAWNAFSKFTHSPRNVRWLKSYRMKPPEHRSYYEY